MKYSSWRHVILPLHSVSCIARDEEKLTTKETRASDLRAEENFIQKMNQWQIDYKRRSVETGGGPESEI